MQTQDLKEQLARLRERCGRRNKEGRSRMLDELCEQYGHSRKHAIKLLGDTLPAAAGRVPPGPLPRYEPVREVIVPIWQAGRTTLRQTAGGRLAALAASPLYGALLPTQKKLLQEISAATLDRLLAAERVPATGRGLSGTKPGSLLRTEIPLCEGASIRSIERITGIHGDTIGRLTLRVGTACAKIMDEKMRGPTCRQIEIDEIWGFIGAKQRNARRSGAYGDVFG